MEYGIVKRAAAAVYERPAVSCACDENRGVISTVIDEILYGMGVQVTGDETRGFVPVKTHYGYRGFIKLDDLRPLSLSRLIDWENTSLAVIDAAWADVLSRPKAQGERLECICRGGLVEFVEAEREKEGWSRIRLADGRRGYVRSHVLAEKKFSQKGLWEGQLPQAAIHDESEFREGVVNTALKYLGVQYRWGGKSPMGIDCSGLASLCYMLNGILIFRDSRIVAEYPVHEIREDRRKKGDLLYFPGHIAIYLGRDQYIHATGNKKDGSVTINSLDAHSEIYRKDLADSLYAVGSIF